MDVRRLLYYRNLRRAVRRERVFRDRLNPLDIYDDTDFKNRYRFSRPVVLQLIDELSDDLNGAYLKYLEITQTLQILLAIFRNR